MTNPTEARITSWIMKDCMTDQGFGSVGGGIRLMAKDGLTNRLELVKEYPVSVEDDPSRLAQALYLDAQEEADGHGNGTHHFALYAFRNGVKEHFAKRAILIVVDGQESVFSEDEQNAKGLLAQAQRHLEATARVNAQSLPSLLHGYHNLLDMTNQQLRHYQTTHLETLTLMKDLFEGKEQRELNMAAQVQRELRVNAILEKVADFAPMILPKLLPGLLGADPEPVKATVVSAEVPNGTTKPS